MWALPHVSKTFQANWGWRGHQAAVSHWPKMFMGMLLVDAYNLGWAILKCFCFQLQPRETRLGDFLPIGLLLKAHGNFLSSPKNGNFG